MPLNKEINQPTNLRDIMKENSSVSHSDEISAYVRETDSAK